jgi:sugar phosphate permease
MRLFSQTLQGIEGADAAFRISGLELGGLLGSLSAGAISDRLIRGNTSPDVGNVGLRVKVWGMGRPLAVHKCQHGQVCECVVWR